MARGASSDTSEVRVIKPRSAAAEEFLSETPEFSLGRTRGDSRSDTRAEKAKTKTLAAVQGPPRSKPKSRRRSGERESPRDFSRDSHRETRRDLRDAKRNQPHEQSLGQWFREITILGLIAVSSALFLTTYVVQAFFIPSESMQDTLQINDRVLVNKLAFRFGDPEPGDIVVFAAKDNQLPQVEPDTAFARGFDAVATALGLKSSEQDLIKRVIATGGQTVEVRVGLLYVDGQDVGDEPYRKDFEVMDDYGPITVPPGHVFVMGDNRQQSKDSRSFGPIPETALVGRAFALIWPFDHVRWLN